ncbi:hypothetical protein Btru_052681 [Bulinus truncatus]|nr:hypothetical protein Btru_052681 [Bulinus truncatus]
MSVTDIKVTMNEDASRVQNQSRTDSVSHRGFWPVPVCESISCDENNCIWHCCVLKVPQHVIWQADVQKIILEKRPEEDFGFTQKAKQHAEDKDNFYFLVKNVVKNGIAARSGLRTGDLILSVNQIAIQSKEKLSLINFRKLNVVELQIQHPSAFSRTAEKYVPQLAKLISNADWHLPEPVSPSTSPPYMEMTLSPRHNLETIPLQVIPKEVSRNGIKDQYKLPLVRIFVVGHATCELVHLLFGDFIPVDLRPCSFLITVKKTENGLVGCRNAESFFYLLTDGRDQYIDIELICVADESFFQHCCSWMFTPDSVFILTFETKRLTQSPSAESRRLYSLAQTVRAGTSMNNGNIFLYGLSSGPDAMRQEEIQTPLYTLPDDFMLIPVIISTTSESSVRMLEKIQSDLYLHLSGIVGKQNIVFSTAEALDMLLSQNSFTITGSSFSKLLENRDGKLLKHQFQILEDLVNTNNLIVTGGINSRTISESTKEYLLPVKLFKSLSCLAKCMEKYRTSMADQNMNWKLCTTGIATRLELLNLAAECNDDKDKLISYMEDFYLIIPLKRSNMESGFDEESDSFLFPYFLEDVPFDQAERLNKYFTLEATEDISVPSFYGLVAKLGQREDCETYDMVSQFVAHFVLNGMNFYLQFHKAERQIHCYRDSSDQEEYGKKSIEELVIQILRQVSDVKFVLKIVKEQPVEGAVGGEVGQRVDPTVDIPSPVHPSCHLTPDLVEGSNDTMNVLEKAQQRVLSMRVVELKSVLPDLHRIYRHLSIENAWEHLAAAFGLTVEQIMLYVSVQSTRQRLPAETFLNSYFLETDCTLGEFLKALLQIVPRYSHCQELAESLWNSAPVVKT